MTKIVILTGAGISAESGLETFRASDGLWAQHRVEDVATPEGFARNPKLVVDFYNARRAQAAEVSPNAAHRALARLEAELDGEVVVITQNVDDLHEQGGWFGEMPYQMDALFDHLAEADVFAAIGTSGNVYPAAGFVAEARRAGAHTIEFNLERSAVGNQFAEHRIGPASHTVPEWVAEVLAARR